MRPAASRSAPAVLAAMLAACVVPERGAPPAAPASEVTVTEAQNGGTVQVATGSLLRVDLPANGTTGFAWTVARTPRNLRLLGDDYAAALPSVGPALAGGEGRQILTFRLIKAGAGTLRLAYRQPWSRASNEDFTLRVSSRQ